jgi:PAS domain S-box-containing protein
VVQDVLVRHRVTGEERVVRCAAAPVEVEGRVIAAVAVNTDVTAARAAVAERERLAADAERARRQAQAAEAAERVAREHLERVITQAPVAMYIARGREHLFEVVNAAWCRITGKRPEEVLGRPFREVFPELAPQGIVEVIERVYDTGEPLVTPAMRAVMDTDGDGEPEEHFFNVVYQPLRDAAGAVYATALVATEVTELAQARRAAERAQAAAEAASRAKSDFLAVMSHELRTPLNAIGGYAELIELGIRGPVTEQQRADLARIQASQRHLLGLIAGVLDYSRVEAGAVTYRLVGVPVADAVAEAEALVAPQLRAKGLGYAWSGAPSGLCVRADREKLQQILLNLLGNAVKFTAARDGAAGRIEVACTVEDDRRDGAPGGRVRLHVRDTGEGIAPEQLERVFEPFVQVDQRLTRPHAGVGLGLAISRDLARGMGGDLTAESTPGVGSTFTLTLPRG